MKNRDRVLATKTIVGQASNTSDRYEMIVQCRCHERVPAYSVTMMVQANSPEQWNHDGNLEAATNLTKLGTGTASSHPSLFTGSGFLSNIFRLLVLIFYSNLAVNSSSSTVYLCISVDCSRSIPDDNRKTTRRPMLSLQNEVSQIS